MGPGNVRMGHGGFPEISQEDLGRVPCGYKEGSWCPKKGQGGFLLDPMRAS